MVADKETRYWLTDKSWWRYDEELKKVVLTDKAPERARKSFELMKEYGRRGSL